MMRRLAAVARSTVAALAGLLIDDVLIVIGTVGTLVLTWALSRAGWVPASALGFFLLAAVVTTLAASLRHAARAARSRET
ncbi:MAG: hypothetical protein ACRDZO_28895 [Egibacteraceae bacterium]